MWKPSARVASESSHCLINVFLIKDGYSKWIIILIQSEGKENYFEGYASRTCIMSWYPLFLISTALKGKVKTYKKDKSEYFLSYVLVNIWEIMNNFLTSKIWMFLRPTIPLQKCVTSFKNGLVTITMVTDSELSRLLFFEETTHFPAFVFTLTRRLKRCDLKYTVKQGWATLLALRAALETS